MMPIDGNSELVDTDKIYEQVEEMPSFPGGSNAFSSFIAANLEYPVVAQETGIQGRVIVKFVVEKMEELQMLRLQEVLILLWIKRLCE